MLCSTRQYIQVYDIQFLHGVTQPTIVLLHQVLHPHLTSLPPASSLA